MGFQAPSHTQIPNEFFEDTLRQLKLVETRVLLIIMRQTLGWHKTRDRISLSQLSKKTGSRVEDVIKATNRLQQLNLISKIVIGENGSQQTFYELVTEDSNNSYPSETPSPPPRKFRVTKETLTKENKKKIKKENATSANASALCYFLLEEIKKKKPNFSGKVSSSCLEVSEKLLKIRSLEELKKVISFMLEDEFFSQWTFSMAKVKKHLDAVESKMFKSPSKKSDWKQIQQENKELISRFRIQYKGCGLSNGKRSIETFEDKVEIIPNLDRPDIKEVININDINFKEQFLNYLSKWGISIDGI